VNPYVAWLKSNIPIVILVVVMIAAAVVLPILSAGKNADLREEVKKRAANDTKLTSIEKATIEISQPGQEPIRGNGPANAKAIAVGSEFEKRLTEDATAVRSFILERNQQSRSLLNTRLFPTPPSDWRDNLQFEFWRALSAQYAAILDEVNAGSPPPASEVEDVLRRADEVFRTQKLAKSAADQLTPEEAEELRNAMQAERVGKYTEQAEQLLMYASPASIYTPFWDTQRPLDLREMFDWEWQLWIKQDILRALHKANEGYSSLLLGPVKRVRSLSVEPLPAPASSGGSTPPPSAFDPSAGAAAAPTDAPAAPPDPKIEAVRDFTVSYTGRVSDTLYDVRIVRLSLVVDTARIPEVLDAIARQNLMTVTDLRMSPTDVHGDLANGFVYGSSITSDLQLTIETIWLREWTAGLMPREVKDVLKPPVS